MIDDLLVGFKHIAKAIDETGPDKFMFGTEESIGYLAGLYTRDKDASVATLYILELAAELKAQGKSLLNRLDELYQQHGVHAEGQKSVYCHGSAGVKQIRQLMETYRTTPPKSFGGLTMSTLRDFETREVKDTDGNVTGAIEKPHGNLVFLDSEPGDSTLSVAARPSGTEPKIKFYFFAQEAVDDGGLAAAKQNAAQRVAKADAEIDAWVQQIIGS